MKTLLASILMVFSACALAQSPTDNPSWLAGLNPGSAGVSCNTTCTASSLCDKFENSYDESWTEAAGSWGFVSEARGSCSSYFVRGSALAAGQFLIITNGTTDPCYVDAWVRIKTEAISDGGSTSVIYLSTNPDGFYCIGIRVGKVGSDLQLYPTDHVSSSYTAQTISADTWYHVGLYWNNSANQAAWYLSTTDALGSAIDSTTPSTTRSVGKVSLGRASSTGTVGTPTFDYDSFTLDNSTFTPVENPL